MNDVDVRSAQEELREQGIEEKKYRLALLAAAKKGDAAQVQRLIIAGADVNAPDMQGLTPLYYASIDGHADCVRLLLAVPGVDVNKAC